MLLPHPTYQEARLRGGLCPVSMWTPAPYHVCILQSTGPVSGSTVFSQECRNTLCSHESILRLSWGKWSPFSLWTLAGLLRAPTDSQAGKEDFCANWQLSPASSPPLHPQASGGGRRRLRTGAEEAGQERGQRFQAGALKEVTNKQSVPPNEAEAAPQKAFSTREGMRHISFRFRRNSKDCWGRRQPLRPPSPQSQSEDEPACSSGK